MATTLVSVEEYLQTSYRPDCDYVDGVILERNLGSYDHSTIQGLLIEIFGRHKKEWNVRVKPELRLKIRDRKYRVPDVMVLPAGAPRTRVIETAPLLCVEVVSPEDRLPELTKRAEDYLSIGVSQTWIFDPETKKAYIYSNTGLQEWHGIMRCGPVVLDPAALFTAAEED